MRSVLFALALSCAATAVSAETFPLRIPAPGGEIILATEAEKQNHDTYRFAAARRAGDTLYLSGVIVFRAKGEGNDVAAFKAQSRRAMERLKASLTAAGATFQDVAMINSFHVWDSPNFAGTGREQFEAFDAVVGEYIKAPYPAWTAVGTTGTLADTGIVEVQMIAHIPAKK